jgi:putative DNA primase/helicase
MVAAVEHVEHGFVGVSRTWLAMDGGGKSTLDPPRLFTGPVAGGAVRLGELRLDLPLIIAEGVESGLAASELLGWPAWAALSARGVAQLVLPTKARDIVIAADRDRNGVGEAAARQSAMRWAHERRRVRIIIPHRLGADANDLLCEAGRGD